MEAQNARNGNQEGADPDFPNADGNRGTRQVNPEGDAAGAGLAVIIDYAFALTACLLGVAFGH